MLVTKTEIAETIFNRGVDPQVINEIDIRDAEDLWVRQWVGDQFYNDIKTNPQDYFEFIEDYIKPIIATGVLYSNFESIITQITDKGYIQLLAEGGASQVSDVLRESTKRGYYMKLMRLIKVMQNDGLVLKNDEDPLFQNFEKLGDTRIIRMRGPERKTNVVY